VVSVTSSTSRHQATTAMANQINGRNHVGSGPASAEYTARNMTMPITPM
jgi:hypothetical protein